MLPDLTKSSNCSYGCPKDGEKYDVEVKVEEVTLKIL